MSVLVIPLVPKVLSRVPSAIPDAEAENDEAGITAAIQIIAVAIEASNSLWRRIH